MAEQKNSLTLIKEETLEKVESMIKEYQQDESLHFPDNYSPQNAMKAAWLVLQEVKDKNNNLALEACTKPSIMYAMFDMVVQGLSVAKKQGYFIPYGKNLSFTRSYFGTLAVTKRLKGVKEIVQQVIYEGDVFEYSIENGVKKIIKHEQKLENINTDNIVGAYCTIHYENGGSYTEIMNMAQINTSWSKTKMNTNKVTKEFPDQMALRTVINRACKYLANTSDDSDLLIGSFNRTTENEYIEDSPEENVKAEIKEKANKTSIGFDKQTAKEAEFEEVKEDKKRAKEPKESKENEEVDLTGTPFNNKPDF